jgi:hypothetical protein
MCHQAIVELRTALFGAVTQQVVAIPCRRFGKTYQSHLLESGFFVYRPLKMGPIDCPESSVRNYHNPLHNYYHPRITTQKNAVLIYFAAET